MGKYPREGLYSSYLLFFSSCITLINKLPFCWYLVNSCQGYELNLNKSGNSLSYKVINFKVRISKKVKTIPIFFSKFTFFFSSVVRKLSGILTGCQRNMNTAFFVSFIVQHRCNASIQVACKDNNKTTTE